MVWPKAPDEMIAGRVKCVLHFSIALALLLQFGRLFGLPTIS